MDRTVGPGNVVCTVTTPFENGEGDCITVDWHTRRAIRGGRWNALQLWDLERAIPTGGISFDRSLRREDLYGRREDDFEGRVRPTHIICIAAV